MSIRCFVAIELDETIRRELAQLQERLRGKLRADQKAVKWVRPENIHLTLKFLGEVADTALADICPAVSEAAAKVEPFTFEVANCGCFPPRGAARVLWTGAGAGQPALQVLQKHIDDALAQLGFAPEQRKFNAHLTLARIKDPRTGHVVRETVEKIEAFTLGAQSAEQVTVFQSELTPKGPIYIALHHAGLKE